MHELSICRGIIEVATAAARDRPGPAPAIARVTVRVGRLTGIAPESLRDAFDLLAPGTALAGAVLVVEEVPIAGRCPECGARFEIATPSLACPECGGGRVELVSGQELQVVSLDAVDGPAPGE